MITNGFCFDSRWLRRAVCVCLCVCVFNSCSSIVSTLFQIRWYEYHGEWEIDIFQQAKEFKKIPSRQLRETLGFFISFSTHIFTATNVLFLFSYFMKLEKLWISQALFMLKMEIETNFSIHRCSKFFNRNGAMILSIIELKLNNMQSDFSEFS